jgi:phosphatidylserine/phosphatidylglycerophosphate/cardiolipin synthase-like enzyme
LVTALILGSMLASAGAGAATTTHKRKKPVTPPPTHVTPPTASPVVPSGAALSFYNNADGSPLLSLIQGASTSLDIEIYTVGDARIRDAIRAALSRGVHIRIIQEPAPVESSCKIFDASSSAGGADCNDERSLVAEVNSGGGTYIPFNKAALCGAGSGGPASYTSTSSACYQHGKMILVDGAQALVSTGNFDATNLCDLSEKPARCNRDYTSVTGDADVVGALSEIFEADLRGSSYDLNPILTDAVREKLTVSPLSLQPLVDFIQSAQTSLVVQNQYLEEPTLNAALVAAARAGRQVSVMVASECAFGKPTASERAKTSSIYSEFDAAGITSRMFSSSLRIDGKPGYLHAKAMVADGSRAWMGSVNGSTTSVSHNREFGVYFSDPAEVGKLADQMNADLAASGAETWQDSLNCAQDGDTAMDAFPSLSLD